MVQMKQKYLLYNNHQNNIFIERKSYLFITWLVIHNCIFISSHNDIAVINSSQQCQHEILSPGMVAHPWCYTLIYHLHRQVKYTF